MEFVQPDADGKHKLVIAPNAGFGNRIRTMVSAIYLAEKLNMDIEHVWLGTPHKCSFDNEQYVHEKSFEYFFTPTIKKCDYLNSTINKVYSEWGLHDYWYKFQSYGQQLLNIHADALHRMDPVNEQMDTSESFLIETTAIPNLSITRDDKINIYKKYFIPHDHFVDNLNILDANTIGISIRMKVFYWYFPDSKIQDEVMIKWLSALDVPVVLFSDDRDYQIEMRKYLKHPIIPNFETNNEYANDMWFLQFLQLSKCSKLYGTFLSSFCEEASYFGGVDYTPLTKDFFSQDT